MILRRWLPLLLVVLSALPVRGLKEEAGAGIVLGPIAAFKVKAPKGWVFDNETHRLYVNASIYPSGKAWSENAPAINSYIHSKYGHTLDYNMTRELRGEEKNRKSTHRDLPTLTTGDGREARVRDLGKDRSGKLVRVAYIDAPEVYCKLVLIAPDQTSFESGVVAFEEVVKSFHFLGPESGEYLASSEARRLLIATTEIRGIPRFVLPQGWQQEHSSAGLSMYRRSSGNAFGLIAAYDSKPSGGDPQADYEAAWKELVSSAFGAGPPPVPESKLDYDGWQVRVGEGAVKRDGRETNIMLAVFSGFGRRASILCLFSDDSFVSELEKMIESVHPYGSLRGSWATGSQSSPQYVGGKLVEIGDGGYASRCYTFDQDGTYDFLAEIKLDSDHYVLSSERGTYSASGSSLTLHGQGGTRSERKDGQVISSRALPAWKRTYTFKLVDIPEAYHGPDLVLEGVEENELDGAYAGGTLLPRSFSYTRGYHPEWRFRRPR